MKAMMLFDAGIPTGSRRGAFAVASTLALVALFACDGDTLYDEDVTDVPPPTVFFERPVQNSEVLTGRPIVIRVSAADTLGVAQIRVTYGGADAGAIEFNFVPPRQAVSVDTVLVLPAGTTGSLELQASSRNGRGAVGRAEPVTLNIAAVDEILPFAGLELLIPDRVELTDSLVVRVTARDNDGGSGLVRMGFTALVVVEGSPDTRVIEESFMLASTASDSVVHEFAFLPPFVDERSVPKEMTLSVSAWAYDEAGNCGAGVTETPQSLACVPYPGGGGQTVIAQGVPQTATTTAVAGRSVGLPSSSRIADAMPDVQRRRLYLSNLGRNRLDVLDLASNTFSSPVAVGSQPWGVGLNRTGDTLIVANSGGTSISQVSLSGTPAENVGARIHTPNAALFQVERQRDINNLELYQIRFYDFSDRPQYIAQDAFGRLLYSTLPTQAAPDGTIRVAEKQSGWQQPETRILLGRGVFEADSTNISILNVDSMRVFNMPFGGDLIEIYDHRNGFPNTIIRSGLMPLDSAIATLEANPDSDIEWARGRYVTELIGLSDTTFVAASGDRRKVAFGEGVVQTGRIIVWDAATQSISNEITVADLVNNASEHILGLDLNSDGSLGAARGEDAAYFFKNDLRLQGRFEAPVQTGRSGAGLHPLHPTYNTFPPPAANALAFVADGQSIRIVDTIHFGELGTIAIRDEVVGPLRVSQPLAGENSGCSPADCIIAKVYAVTDGDAVVIVNVRGRDIS
jgi:DNA-binding beta-propeller fold protein YncE